MIEIKSLKEAKDNDPFLYDWDMSSDEIEETEAQIIDEE